MGFISVGQPQVVHQHLSIVRVSIIVSSPHTAKYNLIVSYSERYRTHPGPGLLVVPLANALFSARTRPRIPTHRGSKWTPVHTISNLAGTFCRFTTGGHITGIHGQQQVELPRMWTDKRPCSDFNFDCAPHTRWQQREESRALLCRKRPGVMPTFRTKCLQNFHENERERGGESLVLVYSAPVKPRDLFRL